MAQRFRFEQAVEILDKISHTPGGGDIFDFRESMEVIVLDHYPNTASDAEAILNTLMLNVEAGPRPDGRDLQALINLKRWCSSLADKEQGLSSDIDVSLPNV